MSETVNTQAETGKKGRMSARELTTLGLLTGVLLLMSVTPLGYFHTFGLDISLMMVPVAIGAMLMGPKAGAWLGLIFGATSFYQAVTGSSRSALCCLTLTLSMRSCFASPPVY